MTPSGNVWIVTIPLLTSEGASDSNYPRFKKKTLFAKQLILLKPIRFTSNSIFPVRALREKNNGNRIKSKNH
jgi:hypothetical protein